MANTTTPATFEWGSAGAGQARAGRTWPHAMTHAQLMVAVDEGWRAFREGVRHVGRAGMDEQTGGGWSFHDLVAHVAGWQDFTARRLRVYRTTGVFPGPGDEAAVGLPAFANADEFNARLVSSHRLVGAEALVDELDTTFRAVRAELEQLTDEQLHAQDDKAIKVIAGNTYGHYEEHAAELELP
jgi:DinB superfamily